STTGAGFWLGACAWLPGARSAGSRLKRAPRRSSRGLPWCWLESVL
ncbi:MAG: hypothetical protein GY718_05635, partial [Lentisphaerae bacterium]|nr:hypothetical protein [Lentisphaerota bacterium]